MENKKKRLLSLLLAGVLSVGLLAGCSKDAGNPGEAPAPTPTPSDENKEAKDSIVIATGNETPSLSPTEHNALAGSI